MKVLNERYVLGHLPKREPDQYCIAGYGMEVAILARVTLLMWRVKGVRFNTFVILVFQWPVYLFCGFW